LSCELWVVNLECKSCEVGVGWKLLS
jgi:hypothetical protein